MRIAAVLLAIACSAWAQARTLEDIPRTIKKSPRFTAEQQFYCLLVLGEKLERRIWFVADGDALYADLDGDGDLTDKNERFEDKGKTSDADHFIGVWRSWSIGKFRFSERYTEVSVRLSTIKTNWRPSPTASNKERTRAFMEEARRTPHPNLAGIHLTIGGKRQVLSNTLFTTSPETAPILHMDAPLTVGLVESFNAFRFWRGEANPKLTVAIGTPGLGRSTFSYVVYDEFDDKARPVVEIEFPAKEPGRFLAPQRHKLMEKC